ncbi:MAG: DUF4388 domain-containing protein [Acidobacteriota bacterium]|nr:DUF4388 domain-containing protein [Acidobacteriota bacterium]
MEFSGRLNAFPPGELLQWAQNERRTGCLVFRRSRRQKRVYFDDGKVVGCLSDDPADYYGQHLLLNGYLTEPQLVDALGECVRTGNQLGQVLAELKLLSEDEVRTSLRRQIIDSVCGLFLWRSGVFYYEEVAPAPAEITPRPVDVMTLVLEGTRWIDELDRIRKVFPHDNLVLRRGPAWPGQDLSFLQQRIAEAVDNETTLERIHWQVKGAYFRFLEAAYDLCLSEVLDLGPMGEATESTSLEISVYDLLLEQAVEEQNRAVKPEPAVPMGILESFRPLWVQEPTADELARLPAELQEVATAFNGHRPLRRLIEKDEADGQAWDYLLEQLKKGNLALIPLPPKALIKRAQGETKGWWQRLFSGD